MLDRVIQNGSMDNSGTLYGTDGTGLSSSDLHSAILCLSHLGPKVAVVVCSSTVLYFLFHFYFCLCTVCTRYIINK